MKSDRSCVTIHMAASLDGFIARKDGSVDWLETADELAVVAGSGQERGRITVCQPPQTFQTGSGCSLRVPTLPGMARIKLREFDSIYAQPGGASPLSELSERLASAAPNDLAAIDLYSYRGLSAPWNDWGHIVARGRSWAVAVARIVLDGAQ